MPFFSRKGDPLQNPYELLDLKYGATDDEISKAFKKLMFTLHPDKQPPGQSPEEAAVIAQKLHDVMDAKSFLLDGEYLTARREYDANLVKAAMKPPPSSSAQQPPIGNYPGTTRTAAATAAAPGKGNNNNNSDSQLHEEQQQQQYSDPTVANTKAGVRFKTNPLPKGKVNVKQWGKAKKIHRDRGRSCPATSRQETSGGGAANDPTTKHKNRHPAKNAINCQTVKNNNESEDSNDECSTTDECGSNSDDGHNNMTKNTINQPQTIRDSRGRRRTGDETDSKNCVDELLRRPNSSKPMNSNGPGIRDQPKQQQQQHPGLKPANAPDTISDKRRSKSDERDGVGVGGNANTPTYRETKRKPESNHVEEKFDSLREAVNAFIRDLTSRKSSHAPSSSIDIPPLDNSDATTFSYLGLLFHLEVPSGVGSDKIMVQTWYTPHRKNSSQVSSMVSQFNARLHKVDTGCRLTFRNMNGKYAFTLTKKADPEHFNKKGLRHGIEYFMEMSIKLHNLINPMDMKKVDRVRLTSRGASSVVR